MAHKITEMETKRNLLLAAKKEMRKFNKPKTEGVQVSLEKQKQINAKLIESAEYGKTDEIQRLLKAGSDMNTMDKYDNTPLMHAAMHGNT